MQQIPFFLKNRLFPVDRRIKTISPVPASARQARRLHPLLVGFAACTLIFLFAGCQAITPPAPEAEGIIGAPGVGDRLYPNLGNGGYDVRHYDLTIAVDVAENGIIAQAVIDAMAEATLRRFNLDFAGLTIDELTVNGAPARFTREESELIITPGSPLPAGQPFQVQIAYHGTPTPLTDNSVGIDSLGWQTQPGGIFAASEPNGSMNWYPVNNHPSDKATYTFRITVPAGYAVGMNGVLTKELQTEAAGEPVTTYVWEVAQPMASYLATIHVGDYDIEVEETPEGVTLRNYFPVDTPDRVRRDFDPTGEMLTFLTDLIGPYPFETYGAVLLTQDVPWALETQTLSIFPVGGADERTVIHELAHQWYGNDVSPAMWEDIWLNEGFASYLHFMWIEEREGEDAFMTTMDTLYDRLAAAQVGSPIPAEPRELFGRAVYFRGAWTLHALRLTVGDDLFFDILRTYYARHAGGNAGTADFLAVVGELAGDPAVELVEAWLYTPELPAHPARAQD
jgi:aminopeptidase N